MAVGKVLSSLTEKKSARVKPSADILQTLPSVGDTRGADGTYDDPVITNGPPPSAPLPSPNLKKVFFKCAMVQLLFYVASVITYALIAGAGRPWLAANVLFLINIAAIPAWMLLVLRKNLFRGGRK